MGDENLLWQAGGVGWRFREQHQALLVLVGRHGNSSSRLIELMN